MVDLWQIIMTLETIFIYSYFFKDNPFYKISEHTFIGVASGIAFALALQSVNVSGVKPLLAGDIMRLLPLVLGLLAFLRFSRKTRWISMYPFAYLIGIGTGVAVRGTITAQITTQIRSLIPLWGADPVKNFTTLLMFAIAVFVICNFMFSIKQTGAIGTAAKIGQYFLMIAFGYSFAGFIYSYTSYSLIAIAMMFTFPGLYLTIIAGLIIAALVLLEYTRKKGMINKAK